MTECTMKDRNECALKNRKGVTLIELLVVVLIVSILAAIAQPQLSHVIVKARAADAINDMQVIRGAVYNYQTDQLGWPGRRGQRHRPARARGLPSPAASTSSTTTTPWTTTIGGGSPFMIGVTLITSDSNARAHGIGNAGFTQVELRG